MAGQRLREIQERGVGPVLAVIDAPARQTRPQAQRDNMRRLRQYLVRCQGLEMLDYPAAPPDAKIYGHTPSG